jgi:hypothetical protein
LLLSLHYHCNYRYYCHYMLVITGKPILATKKLVTLTFGDMAENHVGMEQIGKMVAEGEGFHLPDLQAIQARMEALGATCQLLTLSSGGHTASLEPLPPAYVLVIRKGVNVLLSQAGDLKQINLFEEQETLEYDKKAFMYGRVVDKHARWNLCFDEKSRAPDYAAGKGRIVGYDEVPHMNTLKTQIETVLGAKAVGLKVESNFYYDATKCGIGFHGDSERRKVIGVRIGYYSMPMHWQWYHRGAPVGEPIVVPMDAGDMYIMSEKTVGTDWKKKTIPTLRHATGCAKFTTVKTTVKD